MDGSIDITDVLAHALHPDDNIRSVAEGKLKQLQDLDLPNFLLHLSSQLLREGIPEDSRALAAIILKNSLESRDPALYDGHMDLLALQWLSLDPSIQSGIKENLLMALESDSRLPSSKVIAKVIARIACIEIPENQWEDLIGKLVDNMARPSSPLKQATLEVLEYVFEDIPRVLEEGQVDDVLACVMSAMDQAGELSSLLRLAAVKALHKVLEFAKFEDHAGINSILAAAGSKEIEIKEVEFECLAAIALRYHTKLEPYKETILIFTSQALKGDVESLVVQSIELWSTICQEEIDCRYEEYEEEDEWHETSSFTDPLSSFIPLLLETYLKKEEYLKQEDISYSTEQEGDDEDTDISMSAEQEGDENLENIWQQEADEMQDISMECLGLAARTMKDAIVPLVMQFVERNIKDPHCHSRKVAISPLGFILKGPSVEQLAPLVHVLLAMMNNPEEGVRGRAAWTLGRAFDLVGANRIMRNGVVDLGGIMAVLIERSKDVPQVYGALYFLARGYAKSKSNSSELSPFIKPLINALLCASELAKETPFRLPSCASAYKALTEIVRVSNMQDMEVCRAVFGLMSEIMRRLNTVLHGHFEAISSVERKNRGLLEVSLCDLVEVLIQKLGSSRLGFALQASAKCVLQLLCPLLTRDSTRARDGAAHAIGGLAHAIGGDFGQHMPMLLQYFNVKRLSPVYVQVMCDICHVLAKGKDEEVVPSFDHIMEVLHQGIQESTLQPAILSSFGQIALALGDKFEKYLPLVLEKLKEAAESAEDKDDCGKVREVIFKAYRGILGGINDPKSGLKVAMALVDFTEGVCKEDHSKSMTRNRRNTSVTREGVDTLSLLPPRVGAWSHGLIRLLDK